jgi:hypothetical protein
MKINISISNKNDNVEDIKIKSSKSYHTFDNLTQEDEYFSVFDKVRGKSIELDDPIAKDIIIKGKVVHTIKYEGGFFYVINFKSTLYIVHDNESEGRQLEKFKGDLSKLKTVIAKANKKADAVDDEDAESYNDW